MARKIVINDCNRCPHSDHSGGFTPGGAYPLCGKSKQPAGESYADYKGTRRVLPFKPWEKDGRRGRTEIAGIPDWCPLDID